MGHRCCSKQKIKRGLWSPEEDEKLVRYITTHSHISWSTVPKFAGLQRCGKSCRLRWINYLRPDLKRGCFTAEEEQIIIDIHRILGNRWAQIAKHLPGRTDNEVKNFWNSSIKKKLISQGLDPQTHNLLSSHKRLTSSINSISNNLHQNSNSIFTLTSHDNMPNGDDQIQITNHQTFSSLPNAPPNIPQPLSTSYIPNKSTSDFPHEILYNNNMSNNSSASCMNPSLVEISNNKWVSRVDAEEFRGTIIEEGIQGQEVQKKDKTICDKEIMGVREVNNINSNNNRCNNLEEMDYSFEDSNFDFGLLESVLNSEFMSHDLNYMDELAWNF